MTCSAHGPSDTKLRTNIVKSSVIRIGALILIPCLVIGYLLKDEALERWHDELTEYEKLKDGHYIPVVEAKELSHKRKIGVLIFGDGGTGGTTQHDVGSGMWDFCQKKTCDLIIGLGDNIYPAGVTSVSDPLWKSNFESPYQNFVDAAYPDFWMLIGNHDRRGSKDAQLRYSEHSPIWKMPALDYFIPNLPGWLNIYVLDTTFIASGSKVPPFQSAFKTNFQQQLERASTHLCDKTGWRVLATHHPLVSNGARYNRFRENNVYDALYAFIEDCGINLVLSGHEHLQQHVQMDGVDYLIQGAASSTRTRAKPLQHHSALSRYLGYQLGFGHLSFTAEKVTIRFNDYRGKSLYSGTIAYEKANKRQGLASENFQ